MSCLQGKDQETILALPTLAHQMAWVLSVSAKNSVNLGTWEHREQDTVDKAMQVLVSKKRIRACWHENHLTPLAVQHLSN